MDNIECGSRYGTDFIVRMRWRIMPQITALMSVYNGQKYIKESIDSILNQTFDDFELIIVNDGSNDRTEDLILMYNDKRIRYFSFKENKGVGAALNFGLSKAKGDFVIKVDADDINELNRFELQIEYLRRNKDIAMVHSYVHFFADNDNVRQSNRYNLIVSNYRKHFMPIKTSEEISNALYSFCCILHASIMIRTEVLREFNYDATYRLGEDYHLFYRLNKFGYKIRLIPRELVKVRISSNSTTVKENHDFAFVNFSIKSDDLRYLYSKDNRSMFIWGASKFGSEIKRLCLANGIQIAGFVDSDIQKQGKDYEGVVIISPEKLNAKNHKVIIASSYGKFDIAHYLNNVNFIHIKDYFIIA